MKIEKTQWNEIHWISKTRAFIVRELDNQWNLLEVNLETGELWNWKFFESREDAVEFIEILLDEEGIIQAELEAELMALEYELDALEYERKSLEYELEP